MFKNVLIFISMFSIGCSSPDFYGNKTLEEMADHYERGGSFVSQPAWEIYEIDGRYHLDLHITGGVRSKDYNFNLIQRPVSESDVEILKVEIFNSERTDVLFEERMEINGAMRLGSRTQKQLEKMCGDDGFLNVRITTTTKVLLYRMKKESTSILDIS
jgi:hypothetical protein